MYYQFAKYSSDKCGDWHLDELTPEEVIDDETAKQIILGLRCYKTRDIHFLYDTMTITVYIGYSEKCEYIFSLSQIEW